MVLGVPINLEQKSALIYNHNNANHSYFQPTQAWQTFKIPHSTHRKHYISLCSLNKQSRDERKYAEIRAGWRPAGAWQAGAPGWGPTPPHLT